MPNIANYAIGVRRSDGRWEPCDSTSLTFSYIASSITIALGMLSTEITMYFLAGLAYELDRTLRRPPNTRHLTEARAHEVVKLFLSRLYTRFPVVVVNEELGENGALGYMKRLGPDMDFDPRNHYIHVNGVNFSKMRLAATRNIADFRTWQFVFAQTLFHETAHLFVTFLGCTNSGTLTPPHITCGMHGVYSDELVCGESGRWLEYVVLGGTFELIRNPDSRDDQAMPVPRLVYAGRDCCISQRISRKTIDRVLNYDFQFPYEFEGPVRYPNLQKFSSDYFSSLFHPAGPVNFASMVTGYLQGHSVQVGKSSAVRDVPHDSSARAEKA